MVDSERERRTGDSLGGDGGFTPWTDIVSLSLTKNIILLVSIVVVEG